MFFFHLQFGVSLLFSQGGFWKGEELLALEDRTVDRWRNLDITPNLERCRKSFLVDLKVIEGGGVNTLLGGGRPLSISGRPKIWRSHLCKRIILLTGRFGPHPKKTLFIAHDEIAIFPSHTCYDMVKGGAPLKGLILTTMWVGLFGFSG